MVESVMRAPTTRRRGVDDEILQMNVVVTGGTGFLGQFVVKQLVDRGHRVAALVRSKTSARVVRGLQARPVSGDLDEAVSVETAFRGAGADVLVNLASLGFGHTPTILAAAEASGIGRAIFVSTTSIFTELNTPSKETRRTAEKLIRSSGLKWTIIRPTMIYGTPQDRNMVRLLTIAKRWPLVPLPGGGKGLQQPVHVQDVANSIVASAERPGTIGRTYDLAGPAPMALNEVCRHAAEAVGKDPWFVSIPLWPLEKAVRLVEIVGARPRVSSEQIRRLAEDKSFDITDATVDLDFAPRDFERGIRDEAALLE